MKKIIGNWFHFFIINAFLFYSAPLVFAEQCSAVIPDHNLADRNQINLVFLGMGYQNQPGFLSLLRVVIDIDGREGGFFSKEPFRSNYDRFNLWYVASSERSEGRQEGTALRNRLLALCENGLNLTNVYVLSYSNKPATSVRGAGGPGQGATILWQEEHTQPNIIQDQKYLLLHEFGGHGFGELFDEYVRPSTMSYQERRTASNSINCFVGTYQECLQQAPWRDLIGQGCGDPNRVDCATDDPDANKEVDCYEGCRLFPTGAFRPHDESLLSVHNTFLGLVHERQICRKIQERTQRATGYCYTEFGIGLPPSAREQRPPATREPVARERPSPRQEPKSTSVPPTPRPRTPPSVQEKNNTTYLLLIVIGAVIILVLLVIICVLLMRRKSH